MPIAHETLDRRALAMDRIIAARLREQPELMDCARATLHRWLECPSLAARPVLNEWQAILNGPTHTIMEVLTGEDERSVRLRQSSPFCGILTREERTRILLDYSE